MVDFAFVKDNEATGGHAANVWLCQSLPGSSRHKEAKRAALWDETSSSKTQQGFQTALLPPGRIHFNGKFVVKCPPPND